MVEKGLIEKVWDMKKRLEIDEREYVMESLGEGNGYPSKKDRERHLMKKFLGYVKDIKEGPESRIHFL
jgi:hypothetical protein